MKNKKQLDAIEARLMKDPRFVQQALDMKALRIQAEAKGDQKEFFEKMVDLLTATLVQSQQGTKAKGAGDLMVQNVETAAMMIETLKDFVEVLADKSKEESLIGVLGNLVEGIEDLKKNVGEIAGRKIPAPVVNVPQAKINVEAPVVNIPELKTTVVQETKEATQQTKLLEALLLKVANGTIKMMVQNEEASEAIPVRITDKDAKKFVDAFQQAMTVVGGGGPRSVTITNVTGTPILVALSDRTSIHAGTEASVTDSATSVTLIAQNTARSGGCITNWSTSRLSISRTATATTNSPEYIDYGETWYVPLLATGEVYRGIVTGIWSSAAGLTCQVVENV